MDASKCSEHRAIAETRAVEDVDVMPSVMTDGIEAEYVQLEARPFVGLWTTVRLGPVVLQFGLEEVAVVRRIRVPHDRWAFIVPIEVSARARWNGRAVAGDDMVVCPPLSESFAFDPAGTRFVIVSALPATPFAMAARPLVAGHPTVPVTAACGPDGAALRNDLDRLRLYAESDRAAAIEPARTGDAISARLVAGLRHQLDSGLAASAVRREIVSRAERFFRSHVGEGISVAQLSSATGVSERSLRNAFYDVYTTSPKRYMKLCQLHHVRHELRAVPARGHRHTVTDVATHHGCYELGRFAGEYKSLFGEAPSETLSKTRQRQLVKGAA